MKWVEILGLFTCLIANGYFYKFFLKIDYQAILSLFLPQNKEFYEVILIFVNFFINVITAVNVYDLNSCLRIFGVI